jgi:hypothetical protein
VSSPENQKRVEEVAPPDTGEHTTWGLFGTAVLHTNGNKGILFTRGGTLRQNFWPNNCHRAITPEAGKNQGLLTLSLPLTFLSNTFIFHLFIDTFQFVESFYSNIL